MRLRFYLIALLAFSFGKSAFAQKQPLPPMSITNLTGNYYIVTSYGYPDDKTPFPANSLFVVTDSGIVLIDTPWDEHQTTQLIDTLDNRFHKKIVLAISTHFHADRTAGLEILKKHGAKTFTSKLTRQYAKQSGEKTPEFTFNQDTTFNISGLQIKTYYPGEGHTKDNIVIWFPKDLILFGGCLIKSLDANDIGYTADANLNQWQASVENLIKYYAHAAFIIPGHQGWQGGVEILSHTMDIIQKNR